MRYLAIGLVRLYRSTLGLLFAGRCKYHPTCSQYAIDALQEFGVARGVTLSVWRLVRCNPWSHGGVDHARDQRLFRRPGSSKAGARPSRRSA